MKALSIFFYSVGACMLIASCFTTGASLTWWLGGSALILLIIGCILQFNIKKREVDTLAKNERHHKKC